MDSQPLQHSRKRSCRLSGCADQQIPRMPNLDSPSDFERQAPRKRSRHRSAPGPGGSGRRLSSPSPARLRAPNFRGTVPPAERKCIFPSVDKPFQAVFDGDCHTCEEPADTQHLLLHCRDHEEERTVLRGAFSRLNLPSTSLEQLIRSRASRAVTNAALKKVATYRRCTDLLDVL